MFETLLFPAAFSPLADIWLAICVASVPTLKAVFQSPTLVFAPRRVSRIFMAAVWDRFGDVTDEGGRQTKEELLRSRARGIVVDVGAGHGHTLDYLDWTKVTKYVALEPSLLMHQKIRARAKALGLNEERVLVIPCGMEDLTGIQRHGLQDSCADTVICILTLCSIPDPPLTIKAFSEMFLAKDGIFLFYEHVANPRPAALWWQKRWSVLWSRLFDGCTLDRPTVEYIENAGIWGGKAVWGKDGPDGPEDANSLFWHQAGYFCRDPAK